MIATIPLLYAPVVLQIGWALVHFLWEGTVIALLAAAALRLTMRRSAEVRYLIAGIALILMAASPVMTYVRLGHSSVPPPQESEGSTTVELRGLSIWQQGPEELLNAERQARASAEAAAQPRRSRLRVALLTGMAVTAPALPWVVWVWGLGVVLLSVRLWHGCRLVARARRDARPLADAALLGRFEELMAAFRLRRPVRLLGGIALAGPAVVGAIRPAILIPASVLTGLAAWELDAILAHELAHIRRHDYLANLVQSVIETVLFYHPAVWWVSQRIRVEREHCCDDAAARACGNPASYATALADLEGLRAVPPLAMAATGTALLPRVRRLLAPQADLHRGSRAGGAIASLLVLGIAGVCLARAQAPLPKAPQVKIVFPPGYFGGQRLVERTIVRSVGVETNPLDPINLPNKSLVLHLHVPPEITEQVRADVGYSPFDKLSVLVKTMRNPRTHAELPDHLVMLGPESFRQSAGPQNFGWEIRMREKSFRRGASECQAHGEIDVVIYPDRHYRIDVAATVQTRPDAEHPGETIPVSGRATWTGPAWAGPALADDLTPHSPTIPPLTRPEDMMTLVPSGIPISFIADDPPTPQQKEQQQRVIDEMMRQQFQQMPPALQGLERRARESRPHDRSWNWTFPASATQPSTNPAHTEGLTKGH